MKNTFYQKVTFYISIMVIIISLALPVQASEIQVIPDEAIRLRILANSDSEKDQEIKRSIRDAVNNEITKWVEELTSIDAARTLLIEKLPNIEGIAKEQLELYDSEDSLTVEFNEVQFPTKLYGNTLYPAGMYEAILITIGDGAGENWWCVLFPPLCFLDFSTGVAVEAERVEEEPVDKSFIVVEWYKGTVDWLSGFVKDLKTVF